MNLLTVNESFRFPSKETFLQYTVESRLPSYVEPRTVTTVAKLIVPGNSEPLLWRLRRGMHPS